MTLFKDFLSLVYPEVCKVCGKSLFKHERIVCMKCYHHLPRSRFWGDIDNPAAQVFWGRVPLSNVYTGFLYNKGNSIQQLVHSFKYRGFKDVGYFFGEELGKEICSIPQFEDLSYILPVPLHPKKLKKRGFNQSEIIAQGIGRKTGTEVNANILYRRNFSSTQTRKSKYERWQNVENIFALKSNKKIEGKHVLLVDDVITTGATIEACANALFEAPQVKVSVVAVGFTKG